MRYPASGSFEVFWLYNTTRLRSFKASFLYHCSWRDGHGVYRLFLSYTLHHMILGGSYRERRTLLRSAYFLLSHFLHNTSTMGFSHLMTKIHPFGFTSILPMLPRVLLAHNLPLTTPTSSFSDQPHATFAKNALCPQRHLKPTTSPTLAFSHLTLRLPLNPLSRKAGPYTTARLYSKHLTLARTKVQQE